MTRSRVRTMVVSAATATALVLGGATAASAVIDYVGGGTWQHGNNDITVWSYYLHPSRCHGSSVQGVEFKSMTAPATQWSAVSTQARWWAMDYSYWSYC